MLKYSDALSEGMASKGQIKEKKAARKAAKKQVPEMFGKAMLISSQQAATRLVRKARRMAMKFRMSLQPYKGTYCKHCKARLIPGKNSRVRLNHGKLTTYCLECKNFRRVPVEKKK